MEESYPRGTPALPYRVVEKAVVPNHRGSLYFPQRPVPPRGDLVPIPRPLGSQNNPVGPMRSLISPPRLPGLDDMTRKLREFSNARESRQRAFFHGLLEENRHHKDLFI